jgi:hypothetical protein
MPRPNGAADRSSIASDASEVLNMLGELGDKVLEMDEKVEMMRGEEKKHYESLRRGLKRLKEEKPVAPGSPDVSSVQRGMDALSISEPQVANENGDAPYCICNYCIQRMFLVLMSLMANGSEYCHVCYVRFLREFHVVRRLFYERQISSSPRPRIHPQESRSFGQHCSLQGSL